MDMKEVIASAARKLILEKKVKSARSPDRHFTTILRESRI